MTVEWIDVEEAVKKIADVICNRCGKSCISLGSVEALHCHEEWGYGSHRDLSMWDLHLCESCSEEFKEWVEKDGGSIDISEITLDGNVIGEKDEALVE